MTTPVRRSTPTAEPPPWDTDAAASRGGEGPRSVSPPPFEQMQPVSAMPRDDDGAFEPDAEIEYEDETVAARPIGRRAQTGPASPRTFAEVVQLARAHREAKLLVHLEEHVSLVRFEPAGTIELHLLAGAPKELANELREKLNAWTQAKWMIAVSKSPGAMAIGPAQRATLAAEIEELKKHPAMATLLAEFPDAKITGVHPLAPLEEDETGTG